MVVTPDRQTDRQTDRILDTPTEGASTALPSMGHKDQHCLPARPTRTRTTHLQLQVDLPPERQLAGVHPFVAKVV